MLTKKVKSRIIFLVLTLLLASIIIFTVLKSLEKNVVYFLSPTEIYRKENVSFDKKIRVGGLVKKNSINKNGETISFIITDLKNEIVVSYIGLVPNLFAEEKGVVAEGKLNDKKNNAILVFHALTGDQFVSGTNAITKKDGWWTTAVGPNKAVDTNKYFVICANVLSGCMGSFGPKNINKKKIISICPSPK